MDYTFAKNMSMRSRQILFMYFVYSLFSDALSMFKYGIEYHDGK
jgi:hypothetical protein